MVRLVEVEAWRWSAARGSGKLRRARLSGAMTMAGGSSGVLEIMRLAKVTSVAPEPSSAGSCYSFFNIRPVG